MALNNYGPRGLLDTAPWSPAGLQAGSGLNRYTNMQPGGMPAPMRPDPVQMQQYAPPSLRSLADSLAQYKAQAEAAAAPPPLVGTPGVLPSEHTGQGAGGSSVDHSGVGGGGMSGSDGYSDQNGVGSGESIGSQIGNAFGITGIGDGVKSGTTIAGLYGAIIGGLLGQQVASDPTNPGSVNAVNGMDAGFSVAPPDMAATREAAQMDGTQSSDYDASGRYLGWTTRGGNGGYTQADEGDGMGFGGAGYGWGGDGYGGFNGGYGGYGNGSDGDGGNGGGWANGGVVTADRLHGPDPAGPDEGYGALKSGEFVLTAEAARVIGYDKLAELNKLGRAGKKGLL